MDGQGMVSDQLGSTDGPVVEGGGDHESVPSVDLSMESTGYPPLPPPQGTENTHMVLIILWDPSLAFVVLNCLMAVYECLS